MINNVSFCVFDKGINSIKILCVMNYNSFLFSVFQNKIRKKHEGWVL